MENISFKWPDAGAIIPRRKELVEEKSLGVQSDIGLLNIKTTIVIGT